MQISYCAIFMNNGLGRFAYAYRNKIPFPPPPLPIFSINKVGVGGSMHARRKYLTVMCFQ